MLLTEEEISEAIQRECIFPMRHIRGQLQEAGKAVAKAQLAKLTANLPDVRDAVAEYEFDKVMLNSRFPGLHGYSYKQIADSHKPKQKAREHADAIHTLYAAALIAAKEEGKREERERIVNIFKSYQCFLTDRGVRVSWGDEKTLYMGSDDGKAADELLQSLGGTDETYL